MSDMFPSYASINPADGHALYSWDSDLFAPIDERPIAPAWGGVPPGTPPVLPDAPVPPIAAPVPSIAAPAAVHPNAALLAAALANVQGGGVPAAAPIAIDTTQLEQTLTAAYDQS
jgi:hypothetical protein